MMKLRRDINVSQKAARFMLHRIREVWSGELEAAFKESVEINETFFGGKLGSISNAKCKELKEAGMRQRSQGKTVAIGVKNWETGRVSAKVSDSVDGETPLGFVDQVSQPDVELYADKARGYKGMDREHESVNYFVSEYVREMAPVDGPTCFLFDSPIALASARRNRTGGDDKVPA
ncbi:MAG: transposase [Aestuariivita sp.]|nr:transposase [Aestuariivita sp.]